MQHSNTSAIKRTPASSLFGVSCDLQEERNLGVETSTIRERSIEEDEANPWVIGAVWISIIGLSVLLGVAIARWIF